MRTFYNFFPGLGLKTYSTLKSSRKGEKEIKLDQEVLGHHIIYHILHLLQTCSLASSLLSAVSSFFSLSGIFGIDQNNKQTVRLIISCWETKLGMWNVFFHLEYCVRNCLKFNQTKLNQQICKAQQFHLRQFQTHTGKYVLL